MTTTKRAYSGMTQQEKTEVDNGKILQAPNPKLLEICRETDYKGGIYIGKLLAEEFEAAKRREAKRRVVVGLAALQIGHSKRVFYALGELFINPKVISRSSASHKSKEGCLSQVSDTEAIVDRSDAVQLLWMTTKRCMRKFTFEGDSARIVQHEMDHLDGKLLPVSK